EGAIRTLAFTPSGREVVTAAQENDKVCAWDTATGKKIADLCDLTGIPSAVAISPNGRIVACATYEVTEGTRLCDLASGKQLGARKGGLGHSNALVFSPDGRRLYSGRTDTTVLCWNVPDPPPLAPLSPDNVAD